MHQALSNTIRVLKEKAAVKTDPDEPKIRVNESLTRAAYYYERLRCVLEYQDEHLFLKNAIKRILNRTMVLGLTDSKELARKLLQELVWAHYFPNDSLPVSLSESVASVLRKYQFIRKNLKTRETMSSANDLIISLASSEIEGLLSPAEEKNQYLIFVNELMIENIRIPESEVDKNSLKIQIEISVLRLLFKADDEQVRFVLMKYALRFWPEINKEEAEQLCQNFDQIAKGIQVQIDYSKNSKIFKYIKKNIPPFSVLWEIISANKSASEQNYTDKRILGEKARSVIISKNKNIYRRVARALVRGIFFILFTKTIFAFAVELPYEAKVLGDVNYRSLIINTVLPPAVLLVTGFFIQIPGKKNSDRLIKILQTIVLEGKLNTKKLETLKRERGKSYIFFNFAYTILSIAIIAGVTWGLLALKFSVVSIILFFMFISLVSFLAFRIRNTARELEIESTEDSLINGVFSFIFLPFVIIGKVLSDKWSQYNFTLFFWDFVIEAPFKAMLGVFEAWFSFVREKREEFE